MKTIVVQESNYLTRKPHPFHNPIERRDWDFRTRLFSCITKAKNALGYKPQMEFEDGLKETHRWFVENWENIEKSAEF